MAANRPTPTEHIQQAQDHMSAANMVRDHDHQAAADHLEKAATHANEAGKYFDTHSKNWIQKATSKHKGAFGAQAKKAGMSTGAFASKVTKPGSKASTTTKKRANLAKTLMGMHK
jgi:hypothetical protein